MKIGLLNPNITQYTTKIKWRTKNRGAAKLSTAAIGKVFGGRYGKIKEAKNRTATSVLMK
ncbi:hypothetical protein [Namhaeicola litoreus]|uniref:Uncharacterized protein n=1 Tax=Namhaeicola litoreus TaxID=1052145 RepID=A0ABW3Y4W8_9FLAO